MQNPCPRLTIRGGTAVAADTAVMPTLPNPCVVALAGHGVFSLRWDAGRRLRSG